jgi:hypothetical protein
LVIHVVLDSQKGAPPECPSIKGKPGICLLPGPGNECSAGLIEGKAGVNLVEEIVAVP